FGLQNIEPNNTYSSYIGCSAISPTPDEISFGEETPRSPRWDGPKFESQYPMEMILTLPMMFKNHLQSSSARG
ncbi:hypothetical protein L9F63_019357, partial [Diploptera punctata]